MRACGYYSIGETDSLHMVAEIAKIPFKVARAVHRRPDVRPPGRCLWNRSCGRAGKRPANFRVCGDENGGFYFDYLGIDMDFQFQKG